MILYTSDTCAGCKEVKRYLANKGVRYIERNCTTNNDYLAALIKTTNGVKLFPTLVKGDEYVVGLNWARIAKMIS